MNLENLPLVAALQRKMKWLDARQKVIAENIANANTPGYVPSDLKPLDFSDLLKRASGGAGAAPNVGPGGKLDMVSTSPMDLGGASGPEPAKAEKRHGAFETSPSGNAVVLQDQMVKLAQTQIDYSETVNLYKQQLALFAIALGKK